MIKLDPEIPITRLLKSIASIISSNRKRLSFAPVSANQYKLADTDWLATLVYSKDILLGVSLGHKNLPDDLISAVEKTIGLIHNLEVLPSSLEFLNRRQWSDRHDDCGIETLYRIAANTLRITVRNYKPHEDRLLWKSQAVAEVCLRGQVTWKEICNLPGDLMKSRGERFYYDRNADLFESDEQELLHQALLILNP
jgi:hypothetical protein